MPRYFVAMLVFAMVSAGQGIDPRPKPGDYPVQAAAGPITIGAENWGHGLATPQATMTVSEYIVVEVGFYAEGNQPFQAAAGQFQLRLNGKRTLLSQPAESVAASVRHSDWDTHPELTATAGVNDADVTVGRRTPSDRFPGDPRTRPPVNGPVPGAPEDTSGVQRPPVRPGEVLMRASLPVGMVHPPVAGFLYFHYPGKVKSLKKLELLYDGPAGSAVLVLP